MCDGQPIICALQAIRRWLELIDEVTNRPQREEIEDSSELSIISSDFEDRLSRISIDMANSLKSGDRDSIARLSLQFSRVSQSLLESTLENSGSINQLSDNIHDLLREISVSCQNTNTQSREE